MGGSQQAPQTYSPMEEAQAQMAIDESDWQRQQQQAEVERAREEAAAEEARIARNENLLRTYNAAQDWGTTKASNLGFNDTYGLLDTYNSLLDSARNSMPTDYTDASLYLDSSRLWDQAYKDVESGYQTRYSNEFSNMNPIGWQESYFADTADDDILEAILADQYNESLGTLDAALARGQMSQGAYDNSLRGLDTRRTGARSELEDLGLGILSGYRDELGGIYDQYNDAVTNWQLGRDLNLDDYSGALSNRANTLTGRMRGDIYNALGDTSLFNTDTLMARGRSSAGASNSPLRNAFNDNAEEDKTRTSGTTGVF